MTQSSELKFNFDNQFLKHLAFGYQQVAITPLSNSFLIAHSRAAAQLIDLPDNYWQHPDFLKVFSGSKLPTGSHSIAQVYAGHQFGQYVPQLGDGRAIFIGEVVNHQDNKFDLQLKGAGLTPFSRMGDGRAVLRSTIREFLASEAMAALNIPTTRALCVVGSDQDVYRENVEKGAIMTRLATSHIRFGHFEYWYHQGKTDELNQLADFCLATLYPDCLPEQNPHLAMFKEIIKRTAELIAKWQAHGFAHGVMNTDNMSIVGETLDYGPFGFLDDYQPSFICNHSDHSGRYAFEQQPSIGLWNLNALAITFSNWLTTDEITQALSQYEPILVKHYLALMQAKLGLAQWRASDHQLLGEYLQLMADGKADYSLSFRLLNLVTLADKNNQLCQPLVALFAQPQQNALAHWLSEYRTRLANNSLMHAERIDYQNQHNIKYLLRNYLAQQAIEQAENGQYQEIDNLLGMLLKPFDEQPECEHYAKPTPDWGKSLEISCSS